MQGNWQDILSDAIAERHWLHQHPELTWQEERTAERVREKLSQWNIPWQPYAQYGMVARLGEGKAGEHLAFRADMDALPIHEASGVAYASHIPGKMHACGHDGHTATLLAAAAWFKTHESQLKSPVSLVFQPAEEGGHGAKKMIEEGALAGIDRIYGWHNWPALPFGVALCPDGAVMSGNGTFHMTIQGRGGHSSQPEVTRDPLLAAAAITLNLQQIVSRRVPPQASVVVSVTTLHADSEVTVTPDAVRLEGSIRFSDPRWRQPINALIVEIAQETAQAYGVQAEVDIRGRYGPTINHKAPAAAYRQALREHLGPNCGESDLYLPIMASEDFSYYLEVIPGAFALIGMAEEGESGEARFTAPCHSPNYCFNDRLIETVVGVFARLAGVPPPR